MDLCPDKVQVNIRTSENLSSKFCLNVQRRHTLPGSSYHLYAILIQCCHFNTLAPASTRPQAPHPSTRPSADIGA